jgi:hypothetical protein
MIGIGTPINHSNAPLPKPMTLSFVAYGPLKRSKTCDVPTTTSRQRIATAFRTI